MDLDEMRREQRNGLVVATVIVLGGLAVLIGIVASAAYYLVLP